MIKFTSVTLTLTILALSLTTATAKATLFPNGAQFGWALRDAATDSLLGSRNSDRNFTPASTQKLFTTWIALDLMGGDKTFATQLQRTGTLQGDKLVGDLVIKGGGNPAFADGQMASSQSSDSIFATWLIALRKFGVKKIEGCIVGDGSYLVEEGPHPSMLWEDAGNYYGASVSGLSFNGNIFLANFSGAAAPAKQVTLTGTLPVHVGIAHFNNHLLTGPVESRDSAFFIGGFPSSIRELRGTYPSGHPLFSIKGSLPNPAWTCAREFQDYLVAHGFEITSSFSTCGDSLAMPNLNRKTTTITTKNSATATGTATATSTSTTAVTIAEHHSPPLRDLIRYTNQKSDNMYAATLLALIGKQNGRLGDYHGGLSVVNEYLNRKGFQRDEIHLKDGNGLSRSNWISPNQTTHLLAYASKQKGFVDFRASLLGSPGLPGKLERYGEGWEGRLWVKTGTLEGVSALAGYLKAKSGRLLAFAMTVNNFDGKASEMQQNFGVLLREWASKY